MFHNIYAHGTFHCDLLMPKDHFGWFWHNNLNSKCYKPLHEKIKWGHRDRGRLASIEAIATKKYPLCKCHYAWSRTLVDSHRLRKFINQKELKGKFKSPYFMEVNTPYFMVVQASSWRWALFLIAPYHYSSPLILGSSKSFFKNFVLVNLGHAAPIYSHSI
jgi:hypothetical protein